MISHIKDQLSGRKQVSISTIFQELSDVNPKDIKKSTTVFNSFKLMEELERIANNKEARPKLRIKCIKEINRRKSLHIS